MNIMISIAISAVMTISAAVAAKDALSSTCSVDEKTKAEIAECLNMQTEPADKEFATKGYDLESISEIYGFTLANYLEGYVVDKGIDNEAPYYMISFDNGAAQGEAVVERNEEGRFELTDVGVFADKERSPLSTANFNHDEIERLLSNYSDTNDVIFLQDPFNCLNLVYFKSEGREYFIPYYFMADNSDMNAVLPANTVYDKAEFDRLIAENTYIPKSDGQVGGGNLAPKIEAQGEMTAAKDEESSGINNNAIYICAGLVLLAAVPLCVGIVKKRKQ